LKKHKAGGVAQGEGPEFKSQYHEKEKKICQSSAAVVLHSPQQRKSAA
jgi:hypothetical protein